MKHWARWVIVSSLCGMTAMAVACGADVDEDGDGGGTGGSETGGAGGETGGAASGGSTMGGGGGEGGALAGGAGGEGGAVSCPMAEPSTDADCAGFEDLFCEYGATGCDCASSGVNEGVWTCEATSLCPASEPTTGDDCATRVTCPYGSTACRCQGGMNPQWQCSARNNP